MILDFFKAKRVLENVKSLLSQKTDFSFKIIVIDNSCDKKNTEILNYLKKYKNVQLVINSKNIGYSKAHNKVQKYIEWEYLFIINPDILCEDKSTIQKLIDYMDNNSKVWIVWPKQINDDNSKPFTVRAFPRIHIQIARRTIFRNLPFIKQKVEYDEMKHLDDSKEQKVDWLQSSFILIRKTLWNKIWWLDEDYFLFMSDVELCFQIWKNRFEVRYLPEITVKADWKRCSKGGLVSFLKHRVLRQHLKDAIKYQKKHWYAQCPRKFFNK